MRSSNEYRLLVTFITIAGLIMAFGLAGCDEDENPTVKKEAGIGLDSGPAQDVSPQVDQKPPKPDKGNVWPDIWPADKGKKTDKGYKGSPFGCADDRDCFGQKCCPTPWGVKLCAPSCNLKL